MQLNLMALNEASARFQSLSVPRPPYATAIGRYPKDPKLDFWLPRFTGDAFLHAYSISCSSPV
jgi:hypothetical protein